LPGPIPDEPDPLPDEPELMPEVDPPVAGRLPPEPPCVSVLGLGVELELAGGEGFDTGGLDVRGADATGPDEATGGALDTAGAALAAGRGADVL
jgi:hypothetical protein